MSPNSQPPGRPFRNWPRRGNALSSPDGRRSYTHPGWWWLLEEEVPKMPPIPVVVGMMAAPGMATMSTSQVVWDEATGATYLYTVTTSIGRVALSVPEDEIIMPGPKIEDVTDLL